MRHFLIFLILPIVVQAFSARLSRPWETASSNSPHRYNHHHNSLLVLLHSSGLDASVNDQDKAEKEGEDVAPVASASSEIEKLSNQSDTTLQKNSTTATTPSTARSAISIKSCLPELVSMTRPSNLPGVLLFHMLGSFLVLRQTTMPASFWTIFFKPQMLLTLVALLLTSSTSMLVNDYYDFKLGHDATKIHKPLPSKKITLPTVKNFLTLLYALSLMCVTVLPGAPARMSVTMGLILTFWYTKHLKPKTWLKNFVCASLIALSPLTSGLATLGLISAKYSWQGVAPLMRVVSTLFVGILGREIYMDINDVEDDTKHGIQTVPAVHGVKFASTIGLACSFGVVALAVCTPLFQVLNREISVPAIRRLFLSSLGSFAQLRRSLEVYRTEGMDRAINARAVDEGLLTVALILAGFV